MKIHGDLGVTQKTAWFMLQRIREFDDAGPTVKCEGPAEADKAFCSMLKRAHEGVCHKFSPKQLQRYVNQFAGCHNFRDLDTLEQMVAVAEGLAGKWPPYRDPVRDSGLPSGAPSA